MAKLSDVWGMGKREWNVLDESGGRGGARTLQLSIGIPGRS